MAPNYCKSKPEKLKMLDLSEIRNTIKNLKNDDNLFVFKLDKPNGFVVVINLFTCIIYILYFISQGKYIFVKSF